MLDFSNLEQYRENNRIEAKKALGGLPRSIWETYSAFANTLGGILLLGVVERKDKSLHAIDLPDPEKLVREFWKLVNDREQASANILTADQVQIRKVDGKRIVVITVPRAQRFDRPVYIGGNPLTGTYRRSGEGDYRCTREEVLAMLRDAAVQPQDGRPLERMQPDVLDGDRVGHVLPGRGGPAAAGLGLRDDADRLVAEPLGGLALDNKRAVEVLAALGGQIEPALGQQGSDGLVHGLGGLGRAALADVRAHHFA